MSETVAAVDSNSHHLREKAAAARHAVADLAVEAKNYTAGRLSTIKDATSEKLKSTHENVVGFVQENPYKTIVIAAGVGLLIGMMLKRK